MADDSDLPLALTAKDGIPMHWQSPMDLGIRLVCDIGPLTESGGVRAERSIAGPSLGRLLHLQYQSVDRDLTGCGSRASPSACCHRLYPTYSKLTCSQQKRRGRVEPFIIKT